MARTKRNPIGKIRHDHRHQAVMGELAERPEGKIEIHRQRSGEGNDRRE